MLSKTVSASEKLLLLYEELQPEGMGEFGQLLYSWLIPHVDDYGRFDASPRIIKLRVMPGSDRPISDFKKAIEVMEKVDLIKVYGNGKRYLEIVNFEKFQTFRKDRERQAEYPSPTQESTCHTNDVPETYQENLKEGKLSETQEDIPETYQEHTEVGPNLREVKLSEVKKEGSSQSSALPSSQTLNEDLIKIVNEIDELCERLYKTKKFEKVYIFRNKCIKEKIHYGAILLALKQIAKMKIDGDPMAYATRIIQVESQNYTERDHFKRHEQLKQEEMRE